VGVEAVVMSFADSPTHSHLRHSKDVSLTDKSGIVGTFSGCEVSVFRQLLLLLLLLLPLLYTGISAWDCYSSLINGVMNGLFERISYEH
jgi:hypothetical protein